MARDEATLSSHAADQAWFSMALVNDPNAALVGALRPLRLHPFWAALRRPFERAAPATASSEVVDAMPGLRPHPARWVGTGLLLVLGIGLAAVGLQRLESGAAQPAPTSAAPAGQRLGTTTLQARAAPSREVAVNVAAASAEAALGASDAAARSNRAAISADTARAAGEARTQVRERAPTAPLRASKAPARSASSAKKKGLRRAPGSR